MPKTVTNPILAGIAALLLLQGCGSGGGNLDKANVTPVANAGSAQTVASGATVTLNGSGSNDSDGYLTTYRWSQVSGTGVALSSTSVAQPTFTAPFEATATPLVFSLVVTDNRGATSSVATVTITVSPGANVVVLSGLVRFARAPLQTVSPFGLDYANAIMQPARGVVINALDATSQAMISSSDTTSTGTYTLNVPGNTNIIIQVVARMQRGGTLPLPNWNVDVQNGALGTAYSYSTATLNTSATTQDIDIPLGIGSNGVATGSRYSGPFAILDVIYSEIQTVVAVSPMVNLPALYVDWGVQSDGTFFTVADGTVGQHIALMSDLTEDTDEFDTHVIAHEYGHYIENNFSRSDNIGGTHALGDNLDPRVAWGEGWATAFGAIALNDPLYRDTFVQNGMSVGGGFSVETNPLATAQVPARFDGVGCWCNEASVYSIVWDLYDGTAYPNSPGDTNDTVALGFAPLWTALTGDERITPAFTTIFSFIDAVKKVQPGDAAGINALLAAQNIDGANLDAFATGETHTPIANMLPLYTSISKGTPVVVHTTGNAAPSNDASLYNKLGNRRFLRFLAPGTGTISVTAITSNTNNGDPDFSLYNPSTGAEIDVQNDFTAQHDDTVTGVSVTSGASYLIDAYDCANGCRQDFGVQGTPGDYDLTMAIN